jgi:hypothetical protein
MAENIHFILDYETLGQDVFTVPVVNCSYYKFDWDRFTSDNPYTFNELIKEIQFDKMNVEAQVEQGYNSSATLSTGGRTRAKKRSSRSSLLTKTSRFISSFRIYTTILRTRKISYWWSRSNTFDPILLHRNFRDHMSRESSTLYFLIGSFETRGLTSIRTSSSSSSRKRMVSFLSMIMTSGTSTSSSTTRFMT